MITVITRMGVDTLWQLTTIFDGRLPKPAFQLQLQGRGRRPTPTWGRPIAAAPKTPRLFLLRAIAGWNGHVSAASVHTAKCRRLGGAFAADYNPRKQTRGFPSLAQRHF